MLSLALRTHARTRACVYTPVIRKVYPSADVDIFLDRDSLESPNSYFTRDNMMLLNRATPIQLLLVAAAVLVPEIAATDAAQFLALIFSAVIRLRHRS